MLSALARSSAAIIRDRLITADWAQENALRKIAAEAELSCDVVLFKDFDRSFAVMA